ncbi:NADH cytochrome b5 reductase 3 [Trichuris trichiura]|uniref:NADH-cytochrome b5 reductase n=1 Tax=Trichuris trichiura TaxID=36087 RepID=A0A077Z9T5_TRITR|nr:NADH cytochrome b5 reductase 3 [Trichuris trichiura]
MLSVTGFAAVAYFIYRRVCRPKKLLLDANANYNIKLVEKKEVSHDTRMFRFALHSPNQLLGLPIGQHVYLSAKVNGQLVVRPYTPVSQSDEVGSVTFVIKVYKSNVHPNFPEGGKMTQHLDRMKIGDEINIRGPSGLLVYEGQGKLCLDALVRSVGMIAGGSGITPMYQVMQAMLRDPFDSVNIHLLFANKSEDDILLRDELEAMAKNHPQRCKIWYTVDIQRSADWPYSVGYIDADMLRAHMPSAAPDVLIMMCGPPGMINYAAKPSLDALMYSPSSVFVF